jgi:glycosyltransferase involved in cell wall biosynthesis
VLPSHQENFGISVVESLACGVPVLVSNKVNIWREIEATNAGLIADDTVAGTTQLLTSWAAKTQEQKREMQCNARTCFARNFDIAVTSDRFFSLIQDRESAIAAA